MFNPSPQLINRLTESCDGTYASIVAVRLYSRLMGMNLRYFPDLALSNKCVPVVHFNDELNEMIADMKNVMSAHNGLGIASNQCGYNKNVMLVKDNKGAIHEFINPVIIETQGMTTMKEGCLSAPSVFLNISRPESVLLQYQDRTGESHKIMAEGQEARCILHEMDHLLGVSFLDKVNRSVRKAALSQIKKIVKNSIA